MELECELDLTYVIRGLVHILMADDICKLSFFPIKVDPSLAVFSIIDVILLERLS